MSAITSIYIPRISVGCDEKYIMDVMYQFQIGEVSYIDFTPINKKPGFVEIHDQQYMSAFVHFSRPWTTNRDFWDTIAEDKPYKIQASPREYWLCLKNKNPVQRTMMNIHQVVENGRHLEKIIEEQAKKIEDLEDKMDRTNAVIYQLLSGLFCYKEQKGSLQTHIEILQGKKPQYQLQDTSKWTTYPTTRQGDDCERRLARLEENLKNLENDLSDYGVL